MFTNYSKINIKLTLGITTMIIDKFSLLELTIY